MWNLKRNDKNELTKQKETHRLSQTHGCWGEGIVKNFRKVMYMLLYFKWITNKNNKFTDIGRDCDGEEERNYLK